MVSSQRYCLLIVTVCLMHLNLFGQHEVIEGRVFDVSTNGIIAGAHINDPIHQTGAITDNEGRFSISTFEWPVRLEISSVGYEKLALTILEKGKEEIKIFLSPLTTQLPEAVVSATKPTSDQYPGAEQVLDFIFFGESIFTVVRNRETGEERLEWKTAAGDVIDALPLDVKGEKRLHKSCLGTINLIAGSEVHQLVIEDNVLLGFTPVSSYHSYFWEVEKCVAANPDNVIYKLDFYLGQMVDYRLFEIDRDTDYVFCSVYNEQQIMLLFEEIVPNLMVDLFTNEMLVDHPDNMRAIRDAQEDLDGKRHIFYQPVSGPLFKSNDKLLVFDHESGELKFYTSSGTPLSSIPINYQLKENWGRQVLPDETTEKFYTIFFTRNGTQLNEIHLSDGSLGKPYFFKHQHVQKMGIMNGELYFLETDEDAGFGYRFNRLKKVKIG